MKKTIMIALCGIFLSGYSQPDEVNGTKIDSTGNLKFSYRQLVIPALLIGYGVVGIESDQLQSFNIELRDEITENIDKKVTIDDFSQFAPAGTVYLLNAFGVKGKHDFRDRSVILATSMTLMSVTVYTLKATTKIERPDGSSKNSFPSGHTATAFAGAEFLYQEYKDQSVWYGIAGYAVATGTGIFRMYNNRHWLTDVVAGAGIGILSTKAAYWMFPYINRQLSKLGDHYGKTVSFVSPFYDGRNAGMNVVWVF
ncbi:MAG: phosphatase PAP2 family protein [Flavobacterium sp.]|nr:MAG: phosphatase PAP2 family protein [Flavobacterium sp.]